MTRSQVAQSKKEIDDLKIKLADYEKMSKFQKAVSSDSTAISGLESKLDQVGHSINLKLSTCQQDA